MTINPYSKLGYLAIGKQSADQTAVKPSVYLELLTESLIVNWNQQALMPIAGSIEANRRNVNDKVTVSGTITVNLDSKTIGYLLTNFFGLPSTATIQAGKVYEHVFTPQESVPSYTFDIRLAGDSLVKRYIGVKISQLEISQADNKMQATLTVMATRAFTEARVTNATTSATKFHLDQTSGLTVSDVIEFRDAADPTTVNATASISTVSSENTLVVGSAASASVGDIVTIRRSTPSYTLGRDLIFIGGAKYCDGIDINNAETVNDTEDAGYTFRRDSEERHALTGINQIDRFPSKVLLKGFTAEGNFRHFYASPKFSERTRRGAQTGLRTKIFGAAIDTNSAQAAVLQIGSGASGVRATASVASETSNNLNVVIIANTVDSLVASKDGNNITVKLASTTTTSNTATLVAAAINALSGVSAAASGAGTGQVSTLVKTNFGSGTNRRGRDANEKELLRIDFPRAVFKPFGQNLAEDAIVNEEISFTAFRDTVSGASTKVLLRNAVSSYAS